ncbi:MAG: DMT family transporter [Hyphomicrobiales bacterium]|nr:DMT family transporter [Hyphomicrobiales bacterium]
MQLNVSTLRALFFALCAAIIFTFIFASAKFVGSNTDPVQIVFMRYAGAALVISTIAVIINGGFSGLRSKVPGTHVARAASGVLGEMCIISAPLFMAYEDATAIGLTGGVFAMMLAVFLLKEKASPMHWLAAMICLSGAMLIALVDVGTNDNETTWIGVGIAIGGAVLSGAELFFIKFLTDRDRPLAIMLYVNILAVIMLALPAAWLWKPLDSSDVVWLLVIGPLALLGQLCWIKAFQNADAIIVVPVSYAVIPFSAILGFLAFNQHLGIYEISGALLVIVGGILLARIPAGERRQTRAKA